MIVVVMGVSGSGKTTIGSKLALRLRSEFRDADDFHSAGNKAKMKSGIALDDADRLPWLQSLAALIARHAEQQKSLVLACSALKVEYRDILENDEEVEFVYLKVDFETVKRRLQNRRHEFMNPDLLKSQFDTLEEPRHAIVVDASREPDLIVDEIYSRLTSDRPLARPE